MGRLAFTMIELVFVIVVMGIIGKFGTEFLAQAYKNFTFASVNNKLQAEAEVAVETVASRLQYRIKDSIIARNDSTFTDFKALGSASGDTYGILEWVGTATDSFRADSLPTWSGIIDLDASSSTSLLSPGTNTTSINNIISILSHGSGTTIDNAALYFVGSDTDIDNYAWDGNAITTQNAVLHPIRKSTVGGQENRFIPTNGSTGADNNFTGVDVFEYYQLAWTAYAVGISDYNASTSTGTLRLYYDYQPWEGEKYTDNGIKNNIVMENVSSFRFKAVGSVVKIQVCVKSDLVEEYSLCKEKTVF